MPQRSYVLSHLKQAFHTWPLIVCASFSQCPIWKTLRSVICRSPEHSQPQLKSAGAVQWRCFVKPRILKYAWDVETDSYLQYAEDLVYWGHFDSLFWVLFSLCYIYWTFPVCLFWFNHTTFMTVQWVLSPSVGMIRHLSVSLPGLLPDY